MRRRDFLKLTAPAAILPVALGGFSLRALGASPLFDHLVTQGTCDDHVLVLIQLGGGNDGLNTVIPLDQYATYFKARPNIALQQSQVLKLTNETGLHTQLTGLQNLYNNGKLAVVQSVGYPTPNFSHFRSTDIWLSASDYDQYVDTGWLGRFLEGEYPGFPVGYPNSSMPDPLAIQIGSVISPALEATMANMGMAFTNPTTFYNIIKDAAATGPTKEQLYAKYVRDVGDQITAFATPVKAAATKATNKSTMWPAANQNTLADQLKLVSLLISGGLKTRVYVVTLNGFDTHSNQNTAGAGTPYSHPQLLGLLQQAIAAFQDDLKLNGVEDRVIGMTFSEFGRRIMSNAGGTDHGAAAPLFIFGSKVNAGVYGPNPIIPDPVTVDDNVAMHFDFRSVYASLLKDWFCADDTKIKNVLFNNFKGIPFIQGSTSSGVGANEKVEEVKIVSCYPNPVSSSSQITIHTVGEYTNLALYDNIGREVRTLIDRNLAAGDHLIPFDAGDLSSGTYYLRLQTGSAVITRQIVVTK